MPAQILWEFRNEKFFRGAARLHGHCAQRISEAFSMPTLRSIGHAKRLYYVMILRAAVVRFTVPQSPRR
jgi:hypothetical protein